jgi:predicted small secreted protein
MESAMSVLKTSVLKRLILAILIIAPVAACGTVEGAGKDVSNSARWIRDKVF